MNDDEFALMYFVRFKYEYLIHSDNSRFVRDGDGFYSSGGGNVKSTFSNLIASMLCLNFRALFSQNVLGLNQK